MRIQAFLSSPLLQKFFFNIILLTQSVNGRNSDESQDSHPHCVIVKPMKEHLLMKEKGGEGRSLSGFFSHQLQRRPNAINSHITGSSETGEDETYFLTGKVEHQSNRSVF